MKLSRFLVIFILFCCLSFIKGQYTAYSMFNVGYTYQNQSFAEVGGKILFIKKDEVAFRLGASVLLGSTHNKLATLPKAQADILFNFKENVDVHQGFYYVIGAESTTKYFSPYIGFSVLGIIDFMGGYAFLYPNQYLYKKALKGLNLRVKVNIPLIIFAK